MTTNPQKRYTVEISFADRKKFPALRKILEQEQINFVTVEGTEIQQNRRIDIEGPIEDHMETCRRFLRELQNCEIFIESYTQYDENIVDIYLKGWRKMTPAELSEITPLIKKQETEKKEREDQRREFKIAQAKKILLEAGEL